MEKQDNLIKTLTESLYTRNNESLENDDFTTVTQGNLTTKNKKILACGCDGSGNTVKGRKTHNS
jgi:hypothetical protein